MINSVIIMGRLTADPELRTTQSGINVTSFSVAVDRRYAKGDNAQKTDFINVVAWRNTAEFITNYFHKGSMIAIRGSIQTRNYEDKTGAKRTAFEIIADEVSFCGSKSESAGGYNREPAENSAPAASFSTADADDFSTIDADEDLPF